MLTGTVTVPGGACARARGFLLQDVWVQVLADKVRTSSGARMVWACIELLNVATVSTRSGLPVGKGGANHGGEYGAYGYDAQGMTAYDPNTGMCRRLEICIGVTCGVWSRCSLRSNGLGAETAWNKLQLKLLRCPDAESLSVASCAVTLASLLGRFQQ